MKKLFVITLMIALSLFLFSCGNDASSAPEIDQTQAPTETKAVDEIKMARNLAMKYHFCFLSCIRSDSIVIPFVIHDCFSRIIQDAHI